MCTSLYLFVLACDTVDRTDAMFIFELICYLLSVMLSLLQILTHSRVRDGIWLTPENLREIYAGLKVDQDGNGKDQGHVQ